MPDTPHIKRFEEYRFPNIRHRARVEAMLNDLAEHIERLEEMIAYHRHDDGTGRLSCTPSFRGNPFATDTVRLVDGAQNPAPGGPDGL